MKATFQINDPEAVEVTMRMTLSLREWIVLKNQLKEGYPAWDLSRTISDVVSQAKEKFYPTIEDKEE